MAGYTPVLGDRARQILLGGPEVGGDALLRFYVFHVYLLPALLILVLAVHVWRVRKDGFAVEDREEERAAEAPREEVAADVRA